MKAIILSAGQGKRLLPLTKDTPKAALQIGTQSLLGWQLQEISKTSIEEVVVITGFGADKIEDLVEKSSFHGVRTFFNPFYQNCDNLGTCWVARGEMTRPFVIINGDTIFQAGVLKKLLEDESKCPITIACDQKPSYDSDDMKIIEREGEIQRVSKTLPTNEVTGESIGMIRFNSIGAKMFTEELETIMRKNSGLGKWYLSAIDSLAGNGTVSSCFVDDFSWCEVDDKADLIAATQSVKQWNLEALK